MKFTLASLPYAYDALEPHLDRRTMEIHHTKHHKSYVDKLNAALEKHPELRDRSLESLLTGLQALPEEIRTAVRNDGGGHWNHTLFWLLLSPKGGGEPKGRVAEAIRTSFGSFLEFKERFNTLATDHFSSGWAWLCMDANRKLSIKSTPDHVTPITEGLEPIFVVDVWEHAYYLKFQNERKRFVETVWNVVNWDEVEARYNREGTPLPLASK